MQHSGRDMGLSRSMPIRDSGQTTDRLQLWIGVLLVQRHHCDLDHFFPVEVNKELPTSPQAVQNGFQS